MTDIGIKKFLFATLCMLVAPSGFGSGRVAPADHCLDSRQVDEVFQANERTLAVAASNGQRYRLDLAQACEGVTTVANARMLAKDGWMCGVDNEFIAMDDHLCPVSGVSRIDAAEYAKHARASYTGADGTLTLATVHVQGERRRGFAASSNYCFNPRHVRGWSEDREGVLVEVNPRRSGGNRFYRVELMGTCPQLAGGSAMQMRSRMGIGLICGNPGDTILTGTRGSGGQSGSAGSLQGGFEPLMVASGRPTDFLMTGSDHVQTLGAKFGCPIKAVYPLDKQ
ncbi:hypothetical protein WCE55_04020 [Luteimonas sp. MJ293]|uniref:hypothetical protein n=1 Tax=Luteimonas sp. MJ146 TaxID=3129240 RepID=UPI0031BA7AF9